ncbi:MAG: hypothetical protein ACE5KM_05925 [Planctomycetaceae bacterium]
MPTSPAVADEPFHIRVPCDNIEYGEGVDGTLDLKRVTEVIQSVSPDDVADSADAGASAGKDDRTVFRLGYRSRTESFRIDWPSGKRDATGITIIKQISGNTR